ncbi:helix-turn-helix domain-containing protein [Parachryseolinea silvisoli]|uniref:helix-turn-helix domain-containing protein n=1 Tax=Parachryseolinea silvisoli TaxID=2873601 RepID=UPI002265CA87|nr:helix-turn-helix domain-containing protein [Parachryseolinea silvisoli]MCD9015181.1 helix-turn-helix domain-containing protein [Parachryseolinea silvisoli]
MATANIVTLEDLEVFKKSLLHDLVDIISERKNNPYREWLKSRDVRRILMISPNTLQQLRERGKLSFTKIGSIYYYAYADIARMLEENKAPTRDEYATQFDDEVPVKPRRKS